MKPSENLAAARDHLIEHGWCQRRLWDEDGRHCAAGALYAVDVEAYGSFELSCLATAIREDVSVIAMASDDSVVAGFNDNIATSAGQVIDIYDRAIIIAKEAEA